MGFRFRRSIRVAPGVRLNFSKSGVSTSVGGHGATVNFSNRGTRTTVGVPGTGLSYSATWHGQHAGGTTQAKSSGAFGGIVVAGLGLLLVGFCASRNSVPAAVGTPAATAAAPAAKTAYVVPASANCRSGPRATADIVRHLPRATAVATSTTQDGWTTVNDPNTASCWVASNLLSDTAPISGRARPRGMISTGTVTAGGLAATGGAIAARHAVRHHRHGASGAASDGGCSCSGSRICIGPRGGRYCITSGGSKRYGV